jgi:dipeptidase E
MRDRRLLLLSNSRNAGQEFLEHAKDQIRDLLGDRVKTVLFVPFASVLASYDDFTLRVAQGFSNMRYEVCSLHRAGDPKRAVGEAEAIVVGGGNTFNLLNALYERDLLPAIQERVGNGVPYIGWSAGANAACPTIKTTNDMPIVEPPSFDALNLVPFQINPHFIDIELPGDPAETRAQRLAEFVEVNPHIYVVAMRDGTMLRVEGTSVELQGIRKVRVFVKGQNPTDYSPSDSLQFLLDDENSVLPMPDNAAHPSTRVRHKIPSARRFA